VGIPTAGRRGTPQERFEAKYVRLTESGCWAWTACISKAGYAKFGDGLKVRPAHIWSYEQKKGKVPQGLELDHLCRVRCCVNPDHLEAVTHKVNMTRGIAAEKLAEYFNTITHCPQGHEYSGENTAFSLSANSESSRKYCKECKRLKAIARYRKNRDEINLRRSAAFRRSKGKAQ
jgi:hypothetical protein